MPFRQPSIRFRVRIRMLMLMLMLIPPLAVLFWGPTRNRAQPSNVSPKNGDRVPEPLCLVFCWV
ncbi:hypothetical protein ISF_06963 [Cordyceps fumosorosea ARSEF 2679]|uniref:Uncharacterized protein n=1 Tax=Cordyceps fumosorosea (strain ARSEF 2679) TaxID=1081104 RepID=A0A167QKF7_CORFA|nr:hypothetical protein ISF_06963 [Cordyceps fumosorosea ARSEF 2679]OAA57722.1 hypothetical protein ISF_06963 [Cordyceps fumosorosea ARSEF 2679]